MGIKYMFDGIVKLKDIDRIEPFVVNRFLCRGLRTIPASDILNQYTFALDKEEWVKLAHMLLPSKIITFFTKKIPEERPMFWYDYVRQYFHVSKRIFIGYEQLIDNPIREDIADKMGLSNNQRKSLGLKAKALPKVENLGLGRWCNGT